MSETKNYFHIEEGMLPQSSLIFPFHLYVYNKVNDKYTIFLFANSPLTEEKRKELQAYLEKGAVLAISLRQKRTFLLHVELEENDVPDLREAEKHVLLQNRENKLKEMKNDTSKGPSFELKNEIQGALERNDFIKIIQKARDEISVFNVNVSNSTSLAIKLSDKLLIEDNPTNRIVALCFFLATFCEIKEEEQLGDLICAAFLHHIGLTQLDRKISLMPFRELTEKDQNQYKKHVGLSQHLIKKCGLELGPRSMNVILEHHERESGAGYPHGYRGDKIDYLAKILGIVSHLVDYSEGRVNGQKTPLKMVLGLLKNNSTPPGLEWDFDEKIKSNLTSFISNPITNAS